MVGWLVGGSPQNQYLCVTKTEPLLIIACSLRMHRGDNFDSWLLIDKNSQISFQKGKYQAEWLKFQAKIVKFWPKIVKFQPKIVWIPDSKTKPGPTLHLTLLGLLPERKATKIVENPGFKHISRRNFYFSENSFKTRRRKFNWKLRKSTTTQLNISNRATPQALAE